MLRKITLYQWCIFFLLYDQYYLGSHKINKSILVKLCLIIETISLITAAKWKRDFSRNNTIPLIQLSLPRFLPQEPLLKGNINFYRTMPAHQTICTICLFFAYCTYKTNLAMPFAQNRGPGVMKLLYSKLLWSILLKTYLPELFFSRVLPAYTQCEIFCNWFLI